MAEHDDMTPVTRGELREELAAFEIRLEAKLEAKLEEKFDIKLGLWGGALTAQIDMLGARVDSLATHFEAMVVQVNASFVKFGEAIDAKFAASEQRMFAEFARQASLDERHQTEIAVVDDKYKDLPARVARFETAVLPPEE